MLNLLKMYKLTSGECNKYCGSLDLYRCCDTIFCDLVTIKLNKIILKLQKNEHGLYLDKNNKCIIPFGLRVKCVCFICDLEKRDRNFRREHDRLERKIRDKYSKDELYYEDD